MDVMAEARQAGTGSEYFFRLALEQNCRLNMFFLLDRCQFSHISAPIVMIKGAHFVVRCELADMENEPIIWGSEVSGYFTVRDTQIVHCHFVTRLSRIYNGPLNSMYLVFALPKYIDHNQRRFSRRVALDEEIAMSFGIWHGAFDGGDANRLPDLRWQELDRESCELGEISASGLRIDVAEQSPITSRLQIDDDILLRGDFGLGQKAAVIYIRGLIVRKMPKPDFPGVVSIGCRFTSWRKLESQSWFRSNPREGIAIVAQWLARTFSNVGV